MNETIQPQRLICVGDSLTMAIPIPELEKWVTRVALSLEQSFPGSYSVFNRGFNGANTATGIDRIESEVSYLLPATILVEFGVNDAFVRPSRNTPQVGVAEYKNNLREIHRYFTERNSPVIFIAAHYPAPDQRQGLAPAQLYFPGNQKPYSENYRPYHQAILEVGQELDVPVIDIPREMEAMGVQSAEIVMEDGLHLTPHGNAIYAEAISRRLKEILS